MAVGGRTVLLAVLGLGILSVGAGEPASQPTTTAVKAKRYFQGERVSGKKGAKWEWAVVKKVGKYFMYVEWEGWEGFPGVWLAPDEVRHEGGLAAGFKKPKMKPGPIPPEPTMPEAASGNEGRTGDAPPAPSPKVADGKGGGNPQVTDADLDAALVIKGTDKEADDPPAASGKFVIDPAPAATALGTDRLEVGVGLEGDRPAKGEAFLSFGSRSDFGVAARIRKGQFLSVVRLNLKTAERENVAHLPADRAMIGASTDGRLVVTTAGFFQNLNEVWDVSGATAKKLAAFKCEGKTESLRWVEPMDAGRLLVAGRDWVAIIELDALKAGASTSGLKTVMRVGKVTTDHRPAWSPGGKYFALPGPRNSVLVFRTDGTVAVEAAAGSDSRFVSSTDGTALLGCDFSSGIDLVKGSKFSLDKQWGKVIDAAGPGLILTDKGNLVDLKTGRRVWRYLVGEKGNATPVVGRMAAGRLWALEEPSGLLIARTIPDAAGAAALASPVPPDKLMDLTGRSIAVHITTSGDVAESAIAPLVSAMIKSVGAIETKDSPNALVLTIHAERGTVHRTYSNMLGSLPLGPTTESPKKQEVDCPFASVHFSLKQGPAEVWSERRFAGAGPSLNPPKGRDLQEYANSLFSPPEELVKKVVMPAKVRDPESEEKITSYLAP